MVVTLQISALTTFWKASIPSHLYISQKTFSALVLPLSLILETFHSFDSCIISFIFSYLNLQQLSTIKWLLNNLSFVYLFLKTWWYSIINHTYTGIHFFFGREKEKRMNDFSSFNSQTILRENLNVKKLLEVLFRNIMAEFSTFYFPLFSPIQIIVLFTTVHRSQIQEYQYFSIY